VNINYGIGVFKAKPQAIAPKLCLRVSGVFRTLTCEQNYHNNDIIADLFFFLPKSVLVHEVFIYCFTQFWLVLDYTHYKYMACCLSKTSYRRTGTVLYVQIRPMQRYFRLWNSIL